MSSFADPIFANTDFRVWTCAIPWFETLTVEGGVRLVRGETRAESHYSLRELTI